MRAIWLLPVVHLAVLSSAKMVSYMNGRTSQRLQGE
jgi:hypothetical protein